MDDLPLQVGERHGVVVDDAERADAGRREILQHRRAEPAGADDQHPRALQLLLAGAADLRQHDVARIAFEFFGRKGVAAFMGRTIKHDAEKLQTFRARSCAGSVT